MWLCGVQGTTVTGLQGAYLAGQDLIFVLLALLQDLQHQWVDLVGYLSLQAVR